MNRVGISREYAISSFYHAEVQNVFYSYQTILLKKEGCYIDLLHPKRKIVTEADSVGNYKIQWKNALGDYSFKCLGRASTITIYEVLWLFLTKKDYFKEQSEYLRASSRSDVSDMSFSLRH